MYIQFTTFTQHTLLSHSMQSTAMSVWMRLRFMTSLQPRTIGKSNQKWKPLCTHFLKNSPIPHFWSHLYNFIFFGKTRHWILWILNKKWFFFFSFLEPLSTKKRPQDQLSVRTHFSEILKIFVLSSQILKICGEGVFCLSWCKK